MLVEIGRTTDVPEGEARAFDANGTRIAVVNLGGGEFRAVGDLCSHAQGFLSEGEVDVGECTIECPRHGATFDLETGAARTLPATAPVAAFAVKVEGETVLVEMEG